MIGLLLSIAIVVVSIVGWAYWMLFGGQAVSAATEPSAEVPGGESEKFGRYEFQPMAAAELPATPPLPVPAVEPPAPVSAKPLKDRPITAVHPVRPRVKVVAKKRDSPRKPKGR